MYSICCNYYGLVTQFDNNIYWGKAEFKIVKVIGLVLKGFARTVNRNRLLPIGHRKRGYEE